ncbi:MAG: 4-(cytidine 5'-diphospho)-2-C-methyl-D-erythritol kinase [Puniceicoccales bacterium]|jgi:4-diphosphocytidyl-2-C-methyl-D-erythritol kinase|nr:4-(cytidine 5'-diphospho)-2-C-methyl-D-erythritol kinase [Puniceicoccales bacterium]
MEELAKVFSPAKINLFFAVTGLRQDGYHNILSANCALNFGDEITIFRSPGGGDEIICDEPFLNKNNNTIITALDVFRKKTGLGRHFTIQLKKFIPHEAGFGGGSSNAATLLRAINEICGNILSPTELVDLGKIVGADCPCFIHNMPNVTTGIGDICQPLNEEMISAMENYDLLIFKPAFGVNTKEAYGILRKNFQHLYLGEKEALRRLLALQDAIVAGQVLLPLNNTFSEIFFLEHENLRELRCKMRSIGTNMMLTGSGSGCFCLSHKSLGNKGDTLKSMIGKYCGKITFIKPTSFARKNFSTWTL